MTTLTHSRLAAAAAVAIVTLAGCSNDSGDTSADADSVRTVTTSIGEVSVPTDIESVVVLEGRRDQDIVLSLGLPLRGYPLESRPGVDLPTPIADLTAAAVDDGAESIFLADEINLEAIAEAAPTVIVGRISDVEPILSELQAIAPVIPVGTHDEGVAWQDDLMLVAEATGTQDRAEELIAAYDEEVARIADTYSAPIAETTVVPIGYAPDGTEVSATRLQSVELLAVGAQPSDAFASTIEGSVTDAEYSPEQTLDTYRDAEAILVLVDTEDEVAAAQADALWQQLPAVISGNVVRTDKSTHEGGPTTAMAVLALIEELYQGV